MISSRPTLLAVDLPPPLHGMSSVNRFVTQMVESADNVIVMDMVGPGSLSPRHVSLRKMWHTLSLSCQIISGWRRYRKVYFVANSGLGLYLNLLLATACRLRRIPLILHHHVFVYVSEHRKPMAALVQVMGDSVTHVFLCHCMAEKFAAHYGRRGHYLIASNPVQLTEMVQTAGGAAIPSEVVLGHLSNLTIEKGLATVLETMQQLRQAGLPVRLLLAGPAHPEELALITRYQQQVGGAVEYLGPVFGAAKQEFYRRIDFFLFPTQYANEAQPLVLMEALGAGAMVVATDRGCIAEQLDGVGRVSRLEEFPATVTQLVKLVLNQPEIQRQWRADSKERAIQLTEASRWAFEELRTLILS